MVKLSAFVKRTGRFVGEFNIRKEKYLYFLFWDATKHSWIICVSCFSY